MKTKKLVKKLLDILSYKRPAGSSTELAMIKKYIDVLPNVQIDGHGNRIVRVGSENTTMFSCHTDTVHHTEGMQKVFYDSQNSEIFVDHDECLGADDAAGIIILIVMIRSGINGLYVFHREEEIGGFGSNYIQGTTPELVQGIDRCIAFDRRGVDSIITHQGMERCCSDKFTEEFAQELMKGDSELCFFPDNTGSFTDSANYTHLISECTNVSCGYDYEHTKAEILDVNHLRKLIKSLLNVNFDNLAVDRDHLVVSYDEYDDMYNYRHGYNSSSKVLSGDYSEYLPANKDSDVIIKTIEDLRYASLGDILDYVYDSPEEAAELIKDLRDSVYYDDKAFGGI